MRVGLVRDEVTLDHAPLSMLPQEYRLLRYFIEHRGVMLSRHQILDEV